jgi:hypothetical protein
VKGRLRIRAETRDSVDHGFVIHFPIGNPQLLDEERRLAPVSLP